MNQNKLLSLMSDIDSDYKYLLDPKTDGGLGFNSLLIGRVEDTSIPVWERVNYAYIVFKNVVEMISKDFNALPYDKMVSEFNIFLSMLASINLASSKIDYSVFDKDSKLITDYGFDYTNDSLQSVLINQKTRYMIGYKTCELSQHWFDGLTEIPITFLRDFSFSFEKNEISYHKVEAIAELTAMKTAKLRLVIGWVSPEITKVELKGIQESFLSRGFMILFMDVNIFNGVHRKKSMPRFKPLHQEYQEYDYFDKHAFERIVRVPRHSFNEVVDFYDQAANRDDVTDIYISFYRANANGRLIQTLINATHNQKYVHIYVELSARGDELSNAALIEKLKKECNSEYLRIECSYLGIKIHAKIGLVYMVDGRTICHIGTGNFNEDTAKIYTDIHRITDDAEDITQVEEAFTAMKRKVPIKQRIKDIIVWEIRNQASLGPDGRILLKCNHAIDDDLIRELKHAESCGTGIKTIVRTSPGVDNDMSTLVGQQLEHERVYCFGSGRKTHVYISSSDLMFRNLYKRMEIMTQIKTPEIAQSVMSELWGIG